MTTAYHEIEASKLISVKKQGIQRTEQSDKDSPRIQKTDAFINQYRSHTQKKAGLDRRLGVYCYIARGDKVVDIATGELRSPAQIARDHQCVLLELLVDEKRCYLSDLDQYDAIADSLAKGDKATAEMQAIAYWLRVQRFDMVSNITDVKRPELLTTYDIPPSAIVATHT